MTATESEKQPFYVVVAGPTASGKSALAMNIARLFQGEIINSDSVQLCRGLNIGSAKPSRLERGEISHHLIDLHDPDENFDAARFAALARASVRDVAGRGKLPVVVGGSGLYLRFLWGEQFHDFPHDSEIRESLARKSSEELFARLRSVDPERAAQLHLNDRFRVIRALELSDLTGQKHLERTAASVPAAFPPGLFILLNPPRADLLKNIEERSRQMLKAGLVEEVRSLLKKFPECDKLKPMQSIGYKQAVSFLRGELALEELEDRIIIATRQYAKRQKTWFRKVRADLVLSDVPKDSSGIRCMIQPFLPGFPAMPSKDFEGTVI